jgi:hypothetical protein
LLIAGVGVGWTVGVASFVAVTVGSNVAVAAKNVAEAVGVIGGCEKPTGGVPTAFGIGVIVTSFGMGVEGRWRLLAATLWVGTPGDEKSVPSVRYTTKTYIATKIAIIEQIANVTNGVDIWQATCRRHRHNRD